MKKKISYNKFFEPNPKPKKILKTKRRQQRTTPNNKLVENKKHQKRQKKLKTF